MLPRCPLSMLLFLGALALTVWASVVVTTHMDGSSEMVGQYHGRLAGVHRPIPDGQFTSGHEITGNAEPPGFASELGQVSLHDDSSSPPTRGYFERARMLLYLLRLRHWRKAAHNDTSQADCRT